MVEKKVYRKKGVWNFATLEYDIEACGGAGFDLSSCLSLSLTHSLSLSLSLSLTHMWPGAVQRATAAEQDLGGECSKSILYMLI
jgi:hypothetical protein